ncbi:MAG: carotenoid biosynthesis protein [Promethearchaeia archaeon]
MSVRNGVIMTACMVFLGSVTTYMLYQSHGVGVGIQIMVTLAVATIGEHYVSGEGYYHYTSTNGIFIGRVPIWIPFMWLVIVQSAYLIPSVLGMSGITSIISAGIIGLLCDMAFVEPVLCRIGGLWKWTPVSNGYFSFVPSMLNRLIAPFGNYFVWFVFPVLMATIPEISLVITA